MDQHRDQQEWFNAVLDTMDEGIHVVDARGVTVVYNRAASQLDGVSVGDVLGRHVLDSFPSLGEEGSTLLQVLKTGQALFHRAQTFTNIRGVQVHTVNTTLPIRREGKIVGALEISKDFTYVKHLTDQLSALQEKMIGRKPKKQQTVGAQYRFSDIVTTDGQMLQTIRRAERAARSQSPILVYGETGTGKELLVQSIHNASRQTGAFLAVNCAALPPSLLESLLFGTIRGSFTGAENRAGWFELADNGTLFLDEVQSLPLDVQAKLLRVLQSGEFSRVGDARLLHTNARIVAAMNESPEGELAKGSLRKDLYYRLNVVRLDLPPLRERGEDILLLARHFLEKWNQQLGTRVKHLSEDTLAFFQTYPWPGNVRELEHVIEAALNLMDGEVLTLADLPLQMQESARQYGFSIRKAERQKEELAEFSSAEKSAIDKGRRLSSFSFAEKSASHVEPRTTGIENVWSQSGFEQLWTALNESVVLDDAPSPALPEVLQSIEKIVLERALASCNGNVLSTAKKLGLPRQTLQYKLQKLGLSH